MWVPHLQRSAPGSPEVCLRNQVNSTYVPMWRYGIQGMLGALYLQSRTCEVPCFQAETCARSCTDLHFTRRPVQVPARRHREFPALCASMPGPMTTFLYVKHGLARDLAQAHRDLGILRFCPALCLWFHFVLHVEACAKCGSWCEGKCCPGFPRSHAHPVPLCCPTLGSAPTCTSIV